MTLSEIISEEKEGTEDSYIIETENKWIRFEKSSICFIEREGKNVVFHCINHQVYRERAPLKTVFEKLPHPQFVYINKGIIVNLLFVNNIEHSELRMNGVKDTLSISRDKMKPLKEAIMEFF